MKIRSKGAKVPAVKILLTKKQSNSSLLDVKDHVRSENMVLTKELINTSNL